MAFSLKAILGLETSQFERGVGRAKAGIKKLGASAGALAKKFSKIGFTAVVAGFALLTKNAIALGSELSDIAISTGFATEKFQVFRGALLDAGGEAKSMEKAILIMQKAVVQGSEGLTTYIRAFERLGLNVENLRAMKPEEQFETIGKAIAGAEDQQGALTAAIEIFGQRSAPRLIEVFKRLDQDGYGKMAKDIEEAYGVMDAQTQKALDKASDTIERFKNKSTIYVADLINGIGLEAKLKKIALQLSQFVGNLTVELLTIGPSLIPDSWFDKWKDGINDGHATLIKEQDALISKAKRLAEEKEKAAKAAADAQKPVIEAIVETTESTEDQEKALKKLNKEQEEQYITEKKLEALRLRAAGDNSAADALDLHIQNIKESIRISEKYNITIEEAISLVNALNKASEKKPEDDGGELERQKKITEMKLAALKAETRGEDALAEALRNRIKLAERILEIMQETGATQREATIIANKQVKAELAGDSGSTGGGDGGGSTGGSTGGTNTGKPSIGKDRVGGVQGNFGGYGSRFGPKQTMDERERAAGLNLAGNDTLSGRRGPESLGTAGSKAKSEFGEALTPTNKELSEMNRSLKTIETELTNGN